jgi:N6-adenosine-specific RNA methylase IME4
MKINEVKINEGRRVTDQKKIKELADSIKELGLLNPITVNEDGTLIAGMHRLEACKLLGYEEIKVNKINLSALLAELAEIDENLVRNELHWLEIDKQLRRRKAIYEELHPETKHNSKFKGNQFRSNGIIPSDQKTFTKDTADKLGQSQSNIQKSVARAERIEDEEVIEQIKELDISKTEGTILARFEPEQQKKIIEVKKQKTDSSIKEIVQEIKKEEKKAEQEVKKQQYEQRVETVTQNEFKVDIFNTKEKFRIIYSDPAWSYNDKQDTPQLGGAAKHYDTMSVSEICKLPVNNISEKDSVLFLWVTSPLLEDAFTVIKAWGFKYKTSFVWDKVKHNMGHYNSVRHEMLLIATKGSCTPDNKKLYDSVQSIERNDNHSEKPIEFLNIIDDLYNYGNKLEMFCRNIKKDKWYGWGNEI